MSYMSTTLTVRLDEDLAEKLRSLCLRTGRSQSELVRAAVRRQIALETFEQLRREVLPLAEARGYLTDEDVFRDVS